MEMNLLSKATCWRLWKARAPKCTSRIAEAGMPRSSTCSPHSRSESCAGSTMGACCSAVVSTRTKEALETWSAAN